MKQQIAYVRHSKSEQNEVRLSLLLGATCFKLMYGGLYQRNPLATTAHHQLSTALEVLVTRKTPKLPSFKFMRIHQSYRLPMSSLNLYILSI